MLLPFQPHKLSSRYNLVMAGDVGATKTHLALYKMEEEHLVALEDKLYKSADYANFIEIADEFLKELPSPEALCIGVAGPVLNQHALLSNIGWEIDRNVLSNTFNIRDVHIINDLMATAFGLTALNDHDVFRVHHPKMQMPGNAAVLAPGTGLGEAGIYFDGSYYHPFATEGGHCDFAQRNDFDMELFSYLKNKFGHVSWERLISGPGIVNIYHFLRDIVHLVEPAELKEKLIQGNQPVVISQHAETIEICRQTLKCFFRYLAEESANLSLKLNATGGLFIGGGIIPNMLEKFAQYDFNATFLQIGRLNYFLDNIPVEAILNQNTALLGAAYYGFHH